jgi:radical SAM protein with 4Fe4S-binding SPASM domain
VYDYENGNPLIPTIEKYSRYKRLSNGKFVVKSSLDNHCWRMWSGAVVTWDGKVVPCCFDKDATHEMGNLSKEDFKSIWKGKAYAMFRKQLLKGRKEIDICKNCSEGTKVWA